MRKQKHDPDSIFWVAPDIYVHFVQIDPDVAEVWVTKDSEGISYRAGTYLTKKERDYLKMFEAMPEDLKEIVNKIVKKFI